MILWDTGSNVGQLNGHSKAANSITYKPTRPFRIATASEDFTVCFYEGPPFKFKCSINVSYQIITIASFTVSFH